MTPKFVPPAALCTDSYKLGHMVQYPENTTKVYSNITPRSTHYLRVPEQFRDNKIVVFGIQGMIMELLDKWETTFFNVTKEQALEQIQNMVGPFVGPMGYERGMSNFDKLHDLGYLPLEIKALPEGVTINEKVPFMTITNTHDDFYWLVNYIETYISQTFWQMPTNATIARMFKKILLHYAKLTGTDHNFVDFQGHDFSARGLTGDMANARTGAAHLTSFKGTDSLLGVWYVNQAYEGKNTFVGGSVPATEHSVMTMGGKESEIQTFRRLINDIYPKGIVSIVSDSWDFWKVITEYASTLKDEIMNRTVDDMGFAKVVFRPDSGNPADIICGTALPYPEHGLLSPLPHRFMPTTYVEDLSDKVWYLDSKEDGQWIRKYLAYDDKDQLVEVDPNPSVKGAVQCLWEIFGGTLTSEGYKQLDSHVGLIYGDSISLERADEILKRLMDGKFASGNVVFGIGSFTYQYNTRDTLGIAMKATYGIVNGEPVEIFKNPITDSSMKKSARGLLYVEWDEKGRFILKDQQTPESENNEHNMLQLVVYNGVWHRLVTMETIRDRVNVSVEL